MINNKYVLFIRIPFIRDASGRLYCDSLWAKDLKLHLDYISNFSICCPVIEVNERSDIKNLKITSSAISGFQEITSCNIKQVYELKQDYGWGSVFMNFIPNFLRVRRACKDAEIVHSDGAGWAFPLSFYLIPLRAFYSFQWVIVIESTFFMMRKGERFNIIKFLSHHLHMILLPICVRLADARIFLQAHYIELFSNSDERSLIYQATWLDSENLLTEEEAKGRVNRKKDNTVRLLFAGRLIDSKGLYVLFEAINILEKKGVIVHVDIMGTGEMEGECRQFAKLGHGTVSVSFRDTVAYGAPFFRCLDDYDAVLIPSLTDEQPRIVFDAFSQGVCIIASDTTGLLNVSHDGENAIIFKQGDPLALAEAISHGVDNPSKLAQMGLNGLSYARTKTHSQMHRDRELFLSKVLNIK